MKNIEYEHSFKVKDIKPFIEFCKLNNYKEESIVTQNRIVYENADNAKIIARLTIETNNKKTTTLLDFKNVNKKNGDLNISTESLPLIVNNKNKKSILSILNTLNFNEAANNLRTRYIYNKNNVKFEIDDYIRPEMKVIAIEGIKEEVEKVYLEIKDIIEKTKIL